MAELKLVPKVQSIEEIIHECLRRSRVDDPAIVARLLQDPKMQRLAVRIQAAERLRPQIAEAEDAWARFVAASRDNGGLVLRLPSVRAKNANVENKGRKSQKRHVQSQEAKV